MSKRSHGRILWMESMDAVNFKCCLKESINDIWSSENGRNIENVIRAGNHRGIKKTFQWNENAGYKTVKMHGDNKISDTGFPGWA